MQAWDASCDQPWEVLADFIRDLDEPSVAELLASLALDPAELLTSLAPDPAEPAAACAPRCLRPRAPRPVRRAAPLPPHVHERFGGASFVVRIPVTRESVRAWKWVGSFPTVRLAAEASERALREHG